MIVISLVVISFSYLFSADTDNLSTVEIVSRDAIQNAINMGAMRVDEEVTINEEIAKEAVLRQYIATTDFNDGIIALGMPLVASKPATVAVESYKLLDDFYIAEWLNMDKKIAETREVDVIVYEAKKTVDNQRGRNVK